MPDEAYRDRNYRWDYTGRQGELGPHARQAHTHARKEDHPHMHDEPLGARPRPRRRAPRQTHHRTEQPGPTTTTTTRSSSSRRSASTSAPPRRTSCSPASRSSACRRCTPAGTSSWTGRRSTSRPSCSRRTRTTTSSTRSSWSGSLRRAYAEAGFEPQDVDSGAIILTGEAIKRRNAHAIADIFADQAGKFVCASAGHNLESVLAANGSGAVETVAQPAPDRAERRHRRRHDEVRARPRADASSTPPPSTSGGRLVATDGDGVVTRIEDAAAYRRGQHRRAAGPRRASGGRASHRHSGRARRMPVGTSYRAARAPS